MLEGIQISRVAMGVYLAVGYNERFLIDFGSL